MIITPDIFTPVNHRCALFIRFGFLLITDPPLPLILMWLVSGPCDIRHPADPAEKFTHFLQTLEIFFRLALHVPDVPAQKDVSIVPRLEPESGDKRFFYMFSGHGAGLVILYKGEHLACPGDTTVTWHHAPAN
jgi:hypothetical protein